MTQIRMSRLLRRAAWVILVNCSMAVTCHAQQWAASAQPALPEFQTVAGITPAPFPGQNQFFVTPWEATLSGLPGAPLTVAVGTDGAEIDPAWPANVRAFVEELDLQPIQIGLEMERFIDGHIYPHQNEEGTVYELDVPLWTKKVTKYFGFAVNIAVFGLAEPSLTWIAPDGTATRLLQVDACTTNRDDNLLRMHSNSRRWTGRNTYAVFTEQVEATIDAGVPVWWYACWKDGDFWRSGRTDVVATPLTPSGQIGTRPAVVRPELEPPHHSQPSPELRNQPIGELGEDASTPSLHDAGERSHLEMRTGFQAHIAVLLPADLVGEDGGVLRIAPAGQPRSRASAVELPIRISPPMMAVVGDSVAWGTGLEQQNKYWSLVADTIQFRSGVRPRIDCFAHTGAEVTVGDGSVSQRLTRAAVPTDWMPAPYGTPAFFQTDGCDTQWPWYRNVYGAEGRWPGEVISGEPDVVCQILDVAFRFRDARNGSPLAVPSTFALGFPDGWDRIPHSNLAIPEDVEIDIPPHVMDYAYAEIGQWFDFGPRYDHVLMTACINDVGPIWIHTGPWTDGSTLSEVVERATTECDLTDLLRQMRRIFPNAAIVPTSYHLTVSEQSTLVPQAESLLTQLFQIWLENAVAPVSLDIVAERADAFQGLSESTLSLSVINANAEDGVQGLGTVVAARVRSDGGFGPEHAALTPDPWVYSLNRCDEQDEGCVEFDDPISIQNERFDDCYESYRFDHGDDDPIDVTSHTACIAASALHPNAIGAEAFAKTIMQALDSIGAGYVIGPSLNPHTSP